MWIQLPDNDTGTTFHARRFTHETAIHRADGVLALGQKYTLDEDIAVDGFDEWLELASWPRILEFVPDKRELLGPGRTLHFHATDVDLDAEWVVDLTGDAPAWRRAHEKSAVAVRGTLTDLLLIIYRRIPADTAEVLGDAELLGFWLDRVGFGS